MITTIDDVMLGSVRNALAVVIECSEDKVLDKRLRAVIEYCQDQQREIRDNRIGQSAPQDTGETLDIVFDGPPSHTTGRFVEAEISGKSVRAGEWEQYGECWRLRIPLAKLDIDRPLDKNDPEWQQAAKILSVLRDAIAGPEIDWADLASRVETILVPD